MQLREVTIQGLGGGVIPELFQDELEKVLADIDNPNKPADKIRRITLTIEFKPTENRQSAMVIVRAKSTLPETKPAMSPVHLAKEGKRLVAFGANPNQESLGFQGPELVSEEVSDA